MTETATVTAATASQQTSDVLLRVSGITVRFGGIVALDDVSFDVRRGEIAGLIGPNGAGKTTLFNCLSRLYEWQQGSISFEGADLASVQRHQVAELGIGRTFQNLALFRSMSVRDNIMVGAHCRSRGGFLGWRYRPVPDFACCAAEERFRCRRQCGRTGLLRTGKLQVRQHNCNA